MSQQAKTDEQERIISENIRKYRLQRGLRQEEVAGGLCSVSQFSKLENGKAPVKPDLLKQIAARLGVSVLQLQSVDDHREQLREMLEMAHNSLMAQKVDLALQYARAVATKSKAHHDMELYGQAVFQELQALTQVFRYIEVIELLERVLTEERGCFSPVHLIILELELGRAHAMTGNRERAYSLFYKGEDDYHQLEEIDPNSTEVMQITYLLSRGFLYMRHFQAGLRYARESKRLAVLHGLSIQAVYAETCEVWLMVTIGERAKAKEMYAHTLEEAQKLRILFLVAVLLSNTGDICLLDQDVGEAKSYFQRALKNFLLVENAWEGQSGVCLNLAEVALLEEDEELMLDYVARAKTVLDAKQPHGYMYRARMHVLLSRLHLSKGRTKQAMTELEQALVVYDQHSAYMEAYEVATRIADHLYERQDTRAIGYYRKAIRYDRQAQASSMK